MKTVLIYCDKERAQLTCIELCEDGIIDHVIFIKLINDSILRQINAWIGVCA
jgi:hypothetical protein